MKKTVALSLLTLLAAGMMSGAAFADPPFLNGHIFQNNHRDWDYHDRDRDHDRFQDARQESRLHWQLEKQRLAEQRERANFLRIAEQRRIQEQRRLAHDRYQDRMQHLRMAEARFDRNHPWYGRY
jgi:hypothetical protein